jgi:hypothetical protein
MPYTVTAQNQMLDALNGGTPSSIIGWASLHTAYSTSGANEVAGGSYARQTVTWSAASAGSKASSAIGGTFSIPGSTTVLFVGLWSASTSGTFAGMGSNSNGATPFAYTATLASPSVFTAPGSSYSNGTTVVLFPGAGTTTPTGFTVGTVYFVVSASGATFQLSATSGGSGINASAAGSGIVQGITPEVFGAAGVFTLSTETLSQF